MSGRIVDLAEILVNLRPFKESRRERKRIKSEYRENIRRLNTGEPVKLVTGFDTYHLGDDIEKKHTEVETLIQGKGEEYQKSHIEYRDGDRIRRYEIPKEHEDEIEQALENVIQRINMRNELSWQLELATYGILIGIGFIALHLYL